MHIINVRNVEEALTRGVNLLKERGVKRKTRAGDVLVMEEPVVTQYNKPWERVLFNEKRDSNPFFHFMESLWMLSGRNDVEWISRFSSNIAQFSDDGVTFHGAYGHRWINHFEDPVYGEESLNQLSVAIDLLRQNKNDRRVVVQMWDCRVDLGMKGKDFPCNTTIMFRADNGRLDMTVTNRSNDMIWGAYGANAVHFSFLQEVMASFIGIPIGKYYQFSNNFHAYINTFEKVKDIDLQVLGFTPYETGMVDIAKIVNTPMIDWLSDLEMFISEGHRAIGYRDVFFKKTAIPMLISWDRWKNKENPHRVEHALEAADEIKASDWRKTCQEWLLRRKKK